MISTSSHKNWNLNYYRTVAISGNRGKDADYNGECYPALAPKLSFWKVWHSMQGTINDYDNNLFYIKEYYKLVLSKLNPEKVYNELDNSILLCYENNDEFCHRHIVAAWLELLLDIKVPEQKTEGNQIIEVERPEYIKKELEKIMRKTCNMHGFKSLRAAYIFEKSERLEEKAYNNPEEYDIYMQNAAFLRCDADMAEEEYLEKLAKQKEIKIKKLENK